MKQAIIYILIAILGLHSCSPKIAPYSGEVIFLNKKNQGVIIVESNGYGKNLNHALVDAQINAFKVLMFKGLPGSDLNVPLIENEKKASIKHKAYFNEFFDGGNYKSFMMSSIESSDLIKIRGGKKISMEVVINYNSLRRDLEQNQIIRKFGY